MNHMIAYFASRPLLANVITVMIMLMGVAVLAIVQRDNFPAVDFNEMIVTTRYPGASPRDVELNVTNPVEEALEEVDGIDTVVSYSMENISVVHVRLDTDLPDAEKVKTDVRDAVAQVSDLPVEVDGRPRVDEITTATGIPIIEVGVSGDIPYPELRELARRAKKRLLNVPGVASLDEFGLLDREIKVELSREALERHQVRAADVVDAIARRNIRATGGSFESYTNERNIVTLDQFESPSEAGDVIIRADPGAATVRVRDVAGIRDAFEDEKVRSRMNGRPAISFLVYKKESADIIRTVESIKRLVDDNRHRLPQAADIEYSNDMSRIVTTRLTVAASNGLIGLVLVLVVLSVFLDLRSAFWVALGIPVALLGTVFLLPVFGAYLDSIVLAAMILVIGIIVDDGIVIAENIWLYRERGHAPLDAAVRGTASVYKPVLTTIATTALAFAPMFFMQGMLGSFVYVIPLVVILALFISLVEITAALPAHLIAGAKHAPAAGAHPSGHSRFDAIRATFDRLLGPMLRWRYAVIGVFVAALAGSFWYAGRYMDFVLFPTQSADTFYVTVELPSGASLSLTSEKVAQLERVVESLPDDELDSFVSRIGSHGDFNLGENENWALIGVYLTPYSTGRRDADHIVDSLRDAMSSVEGIERLNFIIDSGGPPVGRPITLRVVGSDDDMREALAGEVMARLESMNGVKDIDRNDKQGKEQVSIDINHLRLANAGLTVADVASAVRLAFDGEVVTSVRYGDEDVDFRVQFEPLARSSLQTLARLDVPNQAGRFVELAEVAEFVPGPGPSNVYHFENERAVLITADVIKDVVTPVAATNAVLRAIDLDDWPGMRLVVGGEAEETAESMVSLGIAFASAAVGIYVVLLLLFNSFSQPLLVLAAIPFGLVGVITAFALHGEALGFLAMLGVVGLTGIVVNDSLILVNLVNRRRSAAPAEPLATIIREATVERLRPILLTSITTVAGLLPMAYGIGGSDPFSAPMALAMGYGIAFATPLTLLLVPALLLVADDFGRVFRRRADHGRGLLKLASPSSKFVIGRSNYQ